MIDLVLDHVTSPIGTILVVAEKDKLCALDYADYKPRMLRLLEQRYPNFRLVEGSNPNGFCGILQTYLAGDFKSVENIPVATGGTPFQQQVWQALRSIPAGTTTTYGALATKLGKPAASRAVGYANSLNPIAIVLPCHRVVGSNAELTGYAGGLERKRWLLEHEGARLKSNLHPQQIQMSFE